MRLNQEWHIKNKKIIRKSNFYLKNMCFSDDSKKVGDKICCIERNLLFSVQWKFACSAFYNYITLGYVFTYLSEVYRENIKIFLSVEWCFLLMYWILIIFVGRIFPSTYRKAAIKDALIVLDFSLFLWIFCTVLLS